MSMVPCITSNPRNHSISVGLNSVVINIAMSGVIKIVVNGSANVLNLIVKYSPETDSESNQNLCCTPSKNMFFFTFLSLFGMYVTSFKTLAL